MMATDTSTYTFSDGRQLIKHIKQADRGQTGFWKFSLSSHDSEKSHYSYMGMLQGRVVYVGAEPILSWPNFLEILKRFQPVLRTSEYQEKIRTLANNSSPEQRENLGYMLSKLLENRILEYGNVLNSMRLSILMELDAISTSCIGEAVFQSDYQLITSAPVQGFEIGALMNESIQRHAQWSQLKRWVTSMEVVPTLDLKVLEEATLPEQQKQQLERLVHKQKSLNRIAELLGKDSLSIAITFAGLAQKNIIKFSLPPTNSNEKKHIAPQVFIVDDSQILIEQFRRLLSNWGYQVDYCLNALEAVEAIAATKPDLIFLDINMPGASGFELIKGIRRIPHIASIPLVLLTAETSVSNQWRAQWASCKFLAKPKASTEVPEFREKLHALLEEVIPQLEGREVLEQDPIFQLQAV